MLVRYHRSPHRNQELDSVNLMLVCNYNSGSRRLDIQLDIL